MPHGLKKYLFQYFLPTLLDWYGSTSHSCPRHRLVGRLSVSPQLVVAGVDISAASVKVITSALYISNVGEPCIYEAHSPVSAADLDCFH